MEIHIGNRAAGVTSVSKEGNKARLSIDGRPYDVDIVITENSSCSVLHDGDSFSAGVISGEDHRSYDVNMFYRSYHVDIVDTQEKYLCMCRSAEEKQDDKIVVPMPGKVVKASVRKGDRLGTGDTVVILEVVKMQNNYKVSSARAVKNILVSEGDSIDNNQVFMALDLLRGDSYEQRVII